MTIGAKLDDKIRRMSQGIRIVQDLRERVRKEGKLELEGDVIFEEHVFLETDGPVCEASVSFKSCADAKLGQVDAPRSAVECRPLFDQQAFDRQQDQHLRLECYRAIPIDGDSMKDAKSLYEWVTGR